MTKFNVFNQADIINSHKEDEILNFAAERNLIDFITPVKLKIDKEVLLSWAEDFEKREIPFAITKNSFGFTLWKEKKADVGAEAGIW